MDSELLLKFIEYFPDYLSALLRTLLRVFGQPLSRQLYIILHERLCTRPYFEIKSYVQYIVQMVYLLNCNKTFELKLTRVAMLLSTNASR